MKKVPLLPNVITAFALSCGLFVIFKMCLINPHEITSDVLIGLAAILLLAAFADLLDGAVARAIKAESEFGSLFDSLADAITFGVGPSIIVLKSIAYQPETGFIFLMTVSAMIYTVCGVLRLVRFNIMANEAKSDHVLVDASKKHFTGLPIPAAAMAAVSGNLFLVSNEFRYLYSLSAVTRNFLLSTMLIALGYLMISRWKFPSFKSLHIRVKSFQMVFITVIIAVTIVYGFLNHFAVIFFLLSWTYLVVALVLSIIRLLSGRKSKRLEEYEPEPDDLEIE